MEINKTGMKLMSYSEIDKCKETTKIPNEIINIKDTHALRMYAYLLTIRDKEDGICYITRKNLTKTLEISKRKAVDCIKYLKETGWIKETTKMIGGKSHNLIIPTLYIEGSGVVNYRELDSEYYVYIHVNKNTNEVLYVGKGTGDRFKDLSSRNEAYLKYIDVLGKDNIECRIIKHFQDEAEAYNYEKEITDLFKSLGQAKYSIKSGF